MPTFFNQLIKFNDSLCHKHKVKQIPHAVLLSLTSNVTTISETSFVTRTSFKFLHNVFNKLAESAVNYADYLHKNLVCVENYQNKDDNVHCDKIETLPFITHKHLCKYSKNERSIIEKLLESDFYNPVAINDFLPRNAVNSCYKLLQKIKETGIPTLNTVIFTRSYRSAVGGSVFFVWKENFAENRETQKHNVIES